MAELVQYECSRCGSRLQVLGQAQVWCRCGSPMQPVARDLKPMGMALLKQVGLSERAGSTGNTDAASIRNSQVLSDMLNSF
jgi:hypothetical protein